MELYTDTYYIQRIQAGDVQCFACLLDKYSRPIHSLILKVVRNQEDAEELAQDTFMKVFKSLNSFKGDCSFSTWIYRIAYNTAISSVRKKRQEFLTIDETALDNVSEEELPASFRSNMMRQILLESAKVKKRNERFSLLAVILASFIMISLAIASLIYMKVPQINLPHINTEVLSFYLYIGALTLLLLWGDFQLRKLFHKREKKGAGKLYNS